LQAEKIGLDFMDVKAIKKMNENKKIVKKYHAFLPLKVTSSSFRVSLVLVSTRKASALSAVAPLHYQ
jgi:hypothetical protein